jgi:putative aldouronate transport system substrate-binding protein
MSTTEEQSVLDMVWPDFETYIEEMRVRFITGAEPLSNFDDYVETLERIGLSQLLQVQQARYNRVMGG